jgi:hypothetical protein
VIATATFGGLIPYLFLLLHGKLVGNPIKHCVFYCLLWAFMGGLIDAFYSFQSYLFGDNIQLLTIIKKTAFDQFVFSAFLTCPFLTVLYMWQDQGFNWLKTRRQLTLPILTIKIATTVVTNWLIWIPSVILIYMMPLSLQIPLFNLVLCFFVLVLSAVQKDEIAPI